MSHVDKNTLIRKNLYILVADNARARLFKATTPVKQLDELKDWAHSEGRLKDSEVYTDRPGGRDTTGGGYHTYAREKEEHPDEERFARQLGEELNKARHEGKYDNLVLIAAPHFLGALRQQLSKECQAMLLTSIDKDLVHRDTATIIEHLDL